MLSFVLLGMLLTGCGRRETTIQNQVAGTWFHDDSYYRCVMKLVSDGSFHSRCTTTFTNATYEWSYDGTWEVKDGVLISTITNSSTKNTDHFEPVGTVDRVRIVEIDGSHLALAIEDQTNLFVRK